MNQSLLAHGPALFQTDLNGLRLPPLQFDEESELVRPFFGAEMSSPCPLTPRMAASYGCWGGLEQMSMQRGGLDGSELPLLCDDETLLAGIRNPCSLFDHDQGLCLKP